MLLLSTDFCTKTEPVWEFAGNIFTIFKIIIPVIIIVLGIVDFAKAIISNDDKAIGSSAKTLMRRVIVGIIIFFIPTIVLVVFNMVDGFDDIESQASLCLNCINGNCSGSSYSSENTDTSSSGNSQLDKNRDYR